MVQSITFYYVVCNYTLMDLSTIIAILALLVAIFNRPMELWWDKRLNTEKLKKPKDDKPSTFRRILNQLFSYLLPIMIIAFYYFYKPLNKEFVFMVCFGFFSFLINFVLSLLPKHESYVLERQNDLTKVVLYQGNLIKEHAEIMNKVIDMISVESEISKELFERIRDKLKE